MRTFRRILLVATSGLAVLAGAGLPTLASAQTPATAPGAVAPSDPWAHERSDVPEDAAVRFGTLPNGMRYALMRNATPPGQASLRLRIDAGSMMETDEQLGLAHFTEHMAFNGTTNIPENELLRILERLGLAFGPDTNAATGFDQTYYQLDLPRTNDETVDTGLRILREQVSEALFESEDIDAERGVIVGEERLRNTPQQRTLKAQLELLAPGQKIANRLPIGDLSIIQSAPRERFVDFYQAYYRPSRATLIAVGDFEVDQMEAKVRAAFADWQPTALDGPDPEIGAVTARDPATAIVVEPGTQSLIQLNWTRPVDTDPDTVAGRIDDLKRDLGLAVLNRRLGEISRQDDPPFLFGASLVEEIPYSVERSTVVAAFNPGGLTRALQTVEQEQRRLVEFGVTAAELDREVATLRTALETAASAAATRTTPALAAGLLNSVNQDTVFTAPQANLDLFNQAVDGITPEQVLEATRRAFQGGGPLALVISPEPVEGGEAAVTAMLEASRQVAVTAPEADAALEWPYADFGTPGQPSDRQTYDAIGTTVVRFGNGVRLTVKPTTFRDEQILVSVSTGLGELSLPADEVSPLGFAPLTFAAGGLGKLTADELSRALTGRTQSVAFTPSEDAFVLSGATRPQDLDLQMQVLAAYLTDPGLRPAPFEQFKGLWPQIIAQQNATPGGAFSVQTSALLAGGDKRQAFPTAEDVAGWTNDQLRSALLPRLAEGPIDVVVVGDVTVEAAVASVASTFGALPDRTTEPQPVEGAEIRRFPAGTPEPLSFTHTGPADQALGYVAWPTTDAVEDRTASRVVDVLARVLDLRAGEEIRERQGLAYAPRVEATASETFDGYGSLNIRAEVSPEVLPTFFETIDTLAAQLRDQAITEDELNRARLPEIERLRRAEAGNEYWLTALADLAADPAELEQITSRISDLEAITPADIQAAAARYLVADKAWRARVTAAPAP